MPRSRRDKLQGAAAGVVTAAGGAMTGAGHRRELVDAADVFAAALASATRSTNTFRAYRADLRDFVVWCREQEVQAVPADPATVVVYVAAVAGAGARPSTIQRRLAAIAKAHKLSGNIPSPTADGSVVEAVADIRRSLGTVPANRKAAIATGELRRLLAVTPSSSLAGARDRALLLLGFATGMRRSELVALDVDDLEEQGDGLRVKVSHGGTGPARAGREVRVPWGRHAETCPILAVRAWRSAAGLASGPLFRAVDRTGRLGPARLTDRSVARIVQRAARRAGLDPTLYAGNSLRRGLITAAAAAGAPERAIMAQTGHRSVTMVRRYIRSSSPSDENAAAYLGL